MICCPSDKKIFKFISVSCIIAIYAILILLLMVVRKIFFKSIYIQGKNCSQTWEIFKMVSCWATIKCLLPSGAFRVMLIDKVKYCSWVIFLKPRLNFFPFGDYTRYFKHSYSHGHACILRFINISGDLRVFATAQAVGELISKSAKHHKWSLITKCMSSSCIFKIKTCDNNNLFCNFNEKIKLWLWF